MFFVLVLPLFYFFTILQTTMSFFFFFNDTATTEIYTLSLHDALPISRARPARRRIPMDRRTAGSLASRPPRSPRSWSVRDRKSTRLNSSHSQISYAVFCLKKKKKIKQHNIIQNISV